jgi:hypothetical protein
MGPHIPRGGNGYALSRDLQPRLATIAGLKPLGRATRKHPATQIRKLAASLDRFGFVLPIVTHGERVVGGWALVLAAHQLGVSEVPAVSVNDLSEAELRALRLALNRLGEDAAWDRKALAIEFSEVLQLEPDIDLEISGFGICEIESLLDAGEKEQPLPAIDAAATVVTQLGDLWILGDHRVFCGDALSAESYGRVLGNEKAEMMFTDPRFYAVADGHASGLAAIKHGNFAAAASELPSAKSSFLKAFFSHAASCSAGGAIHFISMDWKHIKEMIVAAEEIYGEPKDLCIWTKGEAGTGLLYHPSHELIFVFKVGNDAPINNVAVGRNGRQRTNVWDYASEAALNSTTKGKNAPRSAVKPVDMIADAMHDCSKPGGVILDPFSGAGSVLIAAERTKRRAHVIEPDPILVDISIERWQQLTGDRARHAESGRPFVRSGNPGALSGHKSLK